MSNFLKPHREKLFPHISDWSDPHDEIRNRVDWWALPHKDFLVFHPMGARMMYLFFYIAMDILLVLFIGWLYLRGYALAAAISFIALIIMIRSTFIRLRDWKKEHETFYDVLFRDKP